MASIKTNANKAGEIISYRFRACVGRDPATGKQIWRTTTYPKPEGLSPKAERRAVERAAEDWEAKQRTDYRAGLEPDRDRVTLAAFIRSRWWPNAVEAHGYAPNTLVCYRKLSNGVLEYFGERIRLVELDPERIGRFIRWLTVERRYAERTVRAHFRLLDSVLEYAVTCGYLPENPTGKLRKQDKPKVHAKEPDFLSAEEVKAFLNALESDREMSLAWKTFFQLLLFGGLRRGEALAVTWKDYDETRKELMISKSVTLTGNPGAETAVKCPKNGKTRRVPVCDTLAAALERLRLAVVERYGECREDWFIFGAVTNPGQVRNPNCAYVQLASFQKRHGLRRTSVHLLRHSFASLALANGADLKAIQSALGHATAAVTLVYYAGVAEQQTRQAVAAVERVLTGDAPRKKKA